MTYTIITKDISLDGTINSSELVVQEYVPPSPSKPVKSGGGPKNKINSKVFKILEDNEIAACQDRLQAKDNIALREEIIEKTRSKTYTTMFRSGKRTVGYVRRLYNTGELWVGQPRPLLLSFRYDDMGYIIHDGKGHNLMSFEEAYNLCLVHKVADPRFISLETIQKIRSRINSEDPEWMTWAVPSSRNLHDLKVRIGLDDESKIYNCLFFPDE